MVSVCVVTYNHARYIRDCLMSVLAQGEDVPLEILVGDDLSEDETGAVVSALAARHPEVVRYFRHAERLGPTGNYQFLIREARGEYIAHLDGDDFWLPGKLRRQLSVLEGNPSLVAVFSNAVVVDDNGALRGGFNALVPDVFDLGFLLRRGNFLCHGSLVYRASARQSILDIPEPFLDYRIHLKLAAHGDMGYVNCALVGYRVASATSMSTLQSARVSELYWQALSSVTNSSAVRRDLASGMAYFVFISCWNLVSSRRFYDAYEIWKKVAPCQPLSKIEFSIYIARFLAGHLLFKLGNFVSRYALRRRLKIYFWR